MAGSARALIAALFLLPLTASASAQSRLEVRACATLDDVPLRRALDAELAGIADAVPLDVTISCEGLGAITLATRDGRLRRTLDVSDVAPRLHARLVALALAELALGATETTESARAPEARAGEAPDAGDAPTPAGPASVPAIVREGAASTAETTATTATRAALPAPAASSPEPQSFQRDTSSSPVTPRASALGRPDARPRRSARSALMRLTPDDVVTEPAHLAPLARGVVRLFPAQGTVTYGGELLMRLGPVALGAHASGATKDDALGRATASLVLGLAELSLACLDHASFELCVGVRAAIGRAAVKATANTAGTARDLAGPFVEGALGLSGAAILGPVALALDAWLGYAGGVVARADTRTLFALDGLSLALGLSVEVLP